MKLTLIRRRLFGYVNSKSPPLADADAGVIVLDFLDVSQSIGAVSCSFCPRSSNRAAQELAAFATLIHFKHLGGLMSRIGFL